MLRTGWVGALYGAVVFAIYGVVEFGFLCLALFFGNRSAAILTGWHWAVSAAALSVYISAGLLVGAVLGLFILPVGRRLGLRGAAEAGNFLQAALTLSIVVAIAVPMVLRAQRSSVSWFTAAVCLPLIFGLFASTVRGSTSRTMAALMNPWSVLLVALGGPWWWMTLRGQTLTANVLGVLCLVGLAAFFAALDRRLTLSEARAGVVLPFRTALVLVVVAVASVGLGLVVQENTGGSIPYLGGDVSARGPDLVLIVMDTVRADRTSLYGYRRDTTPHLRQLARRATVYNHAVAPSNYTLPTHASLFTGLYPRRHGAYRVGEVHAPLDESFVTLAEILAERGYATAAVSANSAMVTADFGLAQGFRFFKTHYLLPGGPYLRRAVHKLLAFSGVPILEAQYQSADDISDAVLPLLDDLTARRRPFFLFVNYMDAHSPRTAPARFTRPFSDGSPRLSFGRFKRLRSEIESMKRNLTKAEISFIDAEYDGAVAHVDARIGELVERLKRAGRFENTLLIVTSDHGEALGDHHMFDHGFTVYQHQVGIPLLVKYPRQDAPAAVSSPASLVDVMPTVLDVLGFDIPAGLDGMSLRRLGGSDGHSVFSTSFPHDFHGPKAIERYRTGVEAVVSGSWKLHSYGSGEMELYDLSSDPAEQLDRFKKDSPDVKSLLAHLSEWLASAPKYTSVTKPADQRSLERLKTLGYIQ